MFRPICYEFNLLMYIGAGTSVQELIKIRYIKGLSIKLKELINSINSKVYICEEGIVKMCRHIALVRFGFPPVCVRRCTVVSPTTESFNTKVTFM